MESRLLHQFSPTSLRSYHIFLMPFLWSAVVDIAMLLPFYLHLRYAMITHITLMTLICIITFVTALDDLLKAGLSYQDKHFTHKMLGVLLLVAFALQITIGMVSRRAKSSNSHSTKAVLLLRRMHKYLGYSLVLIGKYSTVSILKPSHFAFWFVICWSIPSFAFFMYRVLAYPKAESNAGLILRKI
jgi:hypothetical protein